MQFKADNGLVVEIDVPEQDQLVKDGVWYEIEIIRKAKAGEIFWDNGFVQTTTVTWKEHPILRPIPKPTDEQLKDIGMVINGDKPMVCENGEVVWDEHNGIADSYVSLSRLHGKLRWHLKEAHKVEQPAPPPQNARMVSSKISHLWDSWWVADGRKLNGQILVRAMCRTDFDHIETKSGKRITVLQAFEPNDPPVKAWFRS